MISKTNITVRYAETDMMGIVHHSVYPVYYEAARTEFIKQVGITYSEMEKTCVLLPLIDLNCKYINVAKYEDELEITTRIEELRISRICFYYEVRRKSDQTLINTGSTSHAFVSQEFKPMNLKKHYPKIYDLILKAVD